MEIKLKELLLKKHGMFNFNGLVEFIENTGYVYQLKHLLNSSIRAISTLDSILVNDDRLDKFPERELMFMLLHETAHMKRIDKLGKETTLYNLSLENFEDFMKSVIYEEILADRYACQMFYKLNKEIYPRYYTQQLHLPYRQRQYEKVAMSYYGKIQNSEEKYYQLIESFIREKVI